MSTSSPSPRLLRLLHRALTPFATLAAAASLGAPALAQIINIDVEHGGASWGSPGLDGAASGQQGLWNQIVFPSTGPLASTALFDTNGASLPGVTISATAAPATASTPFCPIWNNDQLGMYDGIHCPSGRTLKIAGLQAGQYEVYTYAKSDSPAPTNVNVTPAVGVPAISQIDAVCPQTAVPHAPFDTYVVHNALIAPGDELKVILSPFLSQSPFTLSAVQIVLQTQPVGTPYCIATTNSTGLASYTTATATESPSVPGQASIAANDLTLYADHMPLNQTGLFFYGPTQTQVIDGDGFMCITGVIGRLDVVQVSPTGILQYSVDYNSPPNGSTAITSGSTWQFQAWYRDPAAGGAGYNYSRPVSIQFAP